MKNWKKPSWSSNAGIRAVATLVWASESIEEFKLSPLDKKELKINLVYITMIMDLPPTILELLPPFFALSSFFSKMLENNDPDADFLFDLGVSISLYWSLLDFKLKSKTLLDLLVVRMVSERSRTDFEDI